MLRCRKYSFLSPRLRPELSVAALIRARRPEPSSNDFVVLHRSMLALCRTYVQVLGKGKQFEIGGGYGVLAVHAGGYGELTVWARSAHETQCLIRQGQIILDKFLNLSWLLRGWAGKWGLGGGLLLLSFDVYFL